MLKFFYSTHETINGKECVNFKIGRIVLAILLLFFIFITSLNSFTTVPAGHVKVATLFGNVKTSLGQGFHFVNPLYDFTEFDVRQQTYPFKQLAVPSSDQLLTKFDVSVQYRANKEMVGTMLQETGTVQNAVDVHLIPKFRSLLREVSKGVEKAEMFYNKEVQQKIQGDLFVGLSTFCTPKGLIIDAILIRNVELPSVIRIAVEEKKKRQQEAEKQTAELARFEIEQQQKIKTAQAELGAAKLEAAAKIARAKAEAKSNELVAKSITNRLIEYQKIQSWDGKLPQVTGSGGTLINMSK